MKVINPATEQVIAEIPEHSPDQIESMIATAQHAFGSWRRQSFEARGLFMGRLAAILRERTGQLALIATREMGKPIVEAEAEVQKCAMICDYFATHAAEMLRPEPLGGGDAVARFDPLGTILGIMPWNYPYVQVIRFAAPALMAGNVGLLRHARNVPGCGIAVAQAMTDAGFPQSVFSNLLIRTGELAQKLVDHPAISAVTLTGSERAGASVAAAAGKVLKKTVMELGGSDAFIILADVDVAAVATQAAAARCLNSGQSCIAAKRFIVLKDIAADFQKHFVAAMKAMRVGDPADRNTQVGPLARLDLRETLHRQVQLSVEQGAKLLCGGRPRDGKGFFYEPTVLGDVHPGMTAFDQETFGPVAAVVVAADVDHAIALANNSCYGLAGTIWTRDMDLAQRVAAELETGMVFINANVKSDPRWPFGGIKKSGWGREMSIFGIREFTNIKTIVANKAG